MTSTATRTDTSTMSSIELREHFASLRDQMDPLPRTGDNIGPDGREFPWGPIVAVHSIGRYHVLEYLRDNSRLGNPTEESVTEHGTSHFHAFIDGRSTSHSYHSLESALVGAIDHARSGPNSRAARMFDLMTLGEITRNDDPERPVPNF